MPFRWYRVGRVRMPTPQRLVPTTFMIALVLASSSCGGGSEETQATNPVRSVQATPQPREWSQALLVSFEGALRTLSVKAGELGDAAGLSQYCFPADEEQERECRDRLSLAAVELVNAADALRDLAGSASEPATVQQRRLLELMTKSARQMREVGAHIVGATLDLPPDGSNFEAAIASLGRAITAFRPAVRDLGTTRQYLRVVRPAPPQLQLKVEEPNRAEVEASTHKGRCRSDRRATVRRAVEQSRYEDDLKARARLRRNDAGVHVLFCADVTRDAKVDAVAYLSLPPSASDRGLTAWILVSNVHGGAEVVYAHGDTEANLGLWGRDVIEMTNVYLPGDAMCCPSGGVDFVRYEWNGSSLTPTRSWHSNTPS